MDWKLMICQNLKQEVHCLSSSNDAKEKYKKIYLLFSLFSTNSSSVAQWDLRIFDLTIEL